jgi:hypothetical protein
MQNNFIKRLPRAKVYLAEFLRSLANPDKVQKKLLFEFLRKNRNTLYGKKYGFSSINSIQEYQEKVPVVEYEDLLPLMIRLKNGEQNIFTKKPVIYFATTSGSTNIPKLIPVTKDRVKNFHKEFSLWGMSVLTKHPQIIRGKTLYFAGPFDEGRTPSGIMYGSISGYLALTTPWFVKRKQVIPPHVYNILDFDRKTKEIAIYALQSSISQIAFAAPIEAILFFDYIKTHRDELLALLLMRGKRFLVKKLSKLPSFTPSLIWPKLKFVGCIKSETNMPYLKTLKEKIGRDDLVIRDPGIYASEGRLSLGLELTDEPISALMAVVNFFEFFDLSDSTYSNPFLIGKLEKGKKYIVVITTPEGLYRYNMGDIVEVVDFKQKLPLIRFVQRNNFLNIVGELSPESQLISAFYSCALKLNLSVNSFTFLPDVSDHSRKPRYEILCEFNDSPSDSVLKKLPFLLDNVLQNLIQDYRQMRQEFGRLGSPIISVVKVGSYDLLNKERLVSSGQPKPLFVVKNNFIKSKFTIVKQFS